MNTECTQKMNTYCTKKFFTTQIITMVGSLTLRQTSWNASQAGLRNHHMKKASGDDGIPVELFQILQDDNVKMLHSICQQIWKTQQWPQYWKMSIFIPISKKGNAKECSNYHTIALVSHASKIVLKILQAKLQQYMNCERPHVQGRGTNCQHTLEH